MYICLKWEEDDGSWVTLLGLDCVDSGGLFTAGETEDITEKAECVAELAEWLSDDWEECEE